MAQIEHKHSAGGKEGFVGDMATPVVKYTVVVRLVEEGTASPAAGSRVTPAHSQAEEPHS